MTLACVDGGLVCGPLLVIGIGGLFAWLRHRLHKCDHPH